MNNFDNLMSKVFGRDEVKNIVDTIRRNPKFKNYSIDVITGDDVINNTARYKKMMSRK